MELPSWKAACRQLALWRAPDSEKPPSRWVTDHKSCHNSTIKPPIQNSPISFQDNVLCWHCRFQHLIFSGRREWALESFSAETHTTNVCLGALHTIITLQLIPRELLPLQCWGQIYTFTSSLSPLGLSPTIDHSPLSAGILIEHNVMTGGQASGHFIDELWQSLKNMYKFAVIKLATHHKWGWCDKSSWIGSPHKKNRNFKFLLSSNFTCTQT